MSYYQVTEVGRGYAVWREDGDVGELVTSFTRKDEALMFADSLNHGNGCTFSFLMPDEGRELL